MSELEINEAYKVFDVSDGAHDLILQEISSRKPWTPDAVKVPGARIDEDVYAEGVLQADPRYKQDLHDLLIDGRLQRFRENIQVGKNKWDIVLREQDFYQHPDNFDITDEVNHDRDPEDHLRCGDGDLIFMDFDNYDIQMVEAKPHEGYVTNQSGERPHVPETAVHQPQDYEGLEELNYRDSKGSDTVTEAQKKIKNLRTAWKSISDNLGNDWTMYQPEFIIGSDLLDPSSLSGNENYALPPETVEDSGYAYGTENGFESVEDSEDMRALNELFFRGEVTDLLEGDRPTIETREVL